MNIDRTVVKPKSIRDVIQGDEFKRQIAKVLPKTISAERFARIAITATFRQPKLLECSEASLLKCLMDLSAMGLEPDGRRAHLVPFKDRNNGYHCSLIVDYKGIAELVRRHGDVAHIHCDCVHENDDFECSFGTGGRLRHVKELRDPGPIYCVYSFVRLRDGTEEFDIMSVEDVERIRTRSRSGDDEKAPWTTDWNEMAKKTVFRRHSKTLPLSPAVREAIEADDEEQYTEKERFAAAKPAVATVAVGAPRPPRRTTRPEPVNNEGGFPEAPPEPSEPPEAEQPQILPVPAPPEPPAPLATQVREILNANGYTEDELMALLRDPSVRLADASHVTLGECPPKALKTVLKDWEDCKLRLDNNRGQ